MYRIEFSNKSIKSLKKIPSAYRKLIIEKIENLATNPYEETNVKALKGITDTFRLRVAKYRIIFTIQDNQLIIFIIDIDHRKNIYKK